MAAHWIKLECSTPDKPEIVCMAAALRIDQDAVVGKLLRVWMWADQNSVSGAALTISAAFIDRLTNRKGFADAMRAAGWLTGDDGSLTFPNFDRHNGATAKRRSETARRMGKLRGKSHHSDANVTNETSLNAKLEEEEEEEEEEEKKSTDHQPPAASPPSPPPDAPAALDAAGGSRVVLPTLLQARDYAPAAGVSPEIAEAWWHECEARPLAPGGQFTDRDGNAIRKWQSHLTSYGRKWVANAASRAPAGRRPAPLAAAPRHIRGDHRL